MAAAFRKLNQQNGFSLAEMLVAVLILLMVSAVVAGGVPAASNAYSKAVDAANAQVLLSTAATALRDELGTAKNVSVTQNVSISDDKGTVRYYSADNGNYSELSVDISDGRPVILVTSYLGETVENSASGDSAGSGASDTLGAGTPTVQWELVSSAAITKKLGLTYESVRLDNGIITFTNLQVLKNSNMLAELEQLEIRVISMA